MFDGEENAYVDFVRRKSQLGGEYGFEPSFIHPKLYDFQSHLVNFACRQGRGAVFADCGLGKTPMQLTWAHNVTRHENKPVLILAPLMVSLQTVEEAEKFDLSAERSLDGTFSQGAGIVTTNYERLARFNPDDFAGVVCDESSIMKNFDGARKGEITEFMKKVKYRLLCSATPSPNDYIELGTSSEALGYLGYMDMLAMFFKNDEDSLHPMSMGSQWRFKSHAQRDFWRWVCSWARAARKPSDLGYDDGAFILPGRIIELHQRHGFYFFGRVLVWKEPLAVAIRSRLKHLQHKQLVKDSTASTIAAGDFILIFKRAGENTVPVTHETGFSTYYGATPVPEHLAQYRDRTDQENNKLSQWIWRRYASCIWDDIRMNHVLEYKTAKEPEDEKHVHPLQLDVIHRCVQMWSNPGETLLTPFLGVGSEAHAAVYDGRRAIGAELKPSYYRQAVKHVSRAQADALAGDPEALPFAAPEPEFEVA